MSSSNNRAVSYSDLTTRCKVHTGSSTVFQILNKDSTGKVHSVFNKSFNLIFGNRLIHIGPLERGLSPFSIGISDGDAEELAKQINRDCLVQWDGEQLLIASRRALSLEHAIQTDHTLSNRPYIAEDIQLNLQWIVSSLNHEEWTTGIVQNREEKQIILDYLAGKNSLYENETLWSKLKELKKVITVKDDKAAKKVFDYWIGRGPGLTPSGDDMLTGICASLSILYGKTHHFHSQLQNYLTAHGLERTTQIGYEYLLYAANHQYHSYLIKICSVLIKRRSPNLASALEEMRAIGHTSGTDTVIGILLGMKSIAP